MALCTVLEEIEPGGKLPVYSSAEKARLAHPGAIPVELELRAGAYPISPVFADIIAELLDRDEMGWIQHGQPLTPELDLNARRELLEEILDGVAYGKLMDSEAGQVIRLVLLGILVALKQGPSES